MRMLKGMMMLGLSLTLGACDVSTPSQITTKEIRLEKKSQSAEIPAAKVDMAVTESIAIDYKKRGDGPLEIVMPYLAGQPMSELDARKQAESYKMAFAKYGVPNAAIALAPVDQPSQLKTGGVHYPVLAALGPEGCRAMTGLEGAETLYDVKNYQMGCEVKDAMTQMIADPSDLRGKTGSSEASSRRLGTAVENYMAGKKNEKLDGMNASTVGEK